MNSNKIVTLSLSAIALAALFKYLQEPAEIPPVEASSSAAPVSTQEVIAQQAQRFSQTALKKASIQPEEVFISEGVKQQMVDIAAAYEENIRYPTYSTPLNSSDWNQLNPRAFIPKKVPLAFNESMSAELAFDQYIAHVDQALPVRVTLSGQAQDRYGEGLELDSVALSVRQNGEDLHLINLYPANDEGKVSTYIGEIPANKISGLSLGETLFSADLTFSTADQARVSAAINIVSNDATLKSVGRSFVEGPHLMIPVVIEADQKGFYRLQANLFDESGEQPVSHLNASFMLESGSTEEILKVHASTLRAKANAGPYIMKDINLTRGPAKPGDKTGYGSSRQASYRVNGFDLDDYSHEAYEDPKAKRRLEFLQKMAGVN